jgi:thymidylate kinase
MLEMNGFEIETKSQNNARQPTQKPGLQALHRLIDELNRSGIRYVQWKSNVRLNESLAGKTDLDLLIDLKQTPDFFRILARHGAKPIYPAQGREIPGISHYLGIDDQTGKFFHLHVHDVLVLGDRLTKNFHIPLEDDFLECGGSILGVKVPHPEAELIILSIRALLKYRDRDVARDILGLPALGLVAPGLTTVMLNELYWLMGQTTLDKVEAHLSVWEEMLPAPPILEFLQLLERGDLSGWKLMRLRARIRRGMSVYQRKSSLENTVAYFHEGWLRRHKLLNSGQKKKMTMGKKGLRIAIVGADGAGKSTLVRHLAKWLSWRLNVRVYYMGKPRSRLRLKAVRAFSLLARKSASVIRRVFGKTNSFTKACTSLADWSEALQALEEGRGRYSQFLASERDTREGTIILYDRYPIGEIQVFDHAMDGPRINPNANGPFGPRIEKLAQEERDLYEKILPPDLTIFLQASAEVLQRRKPDHDPHVISVKARAMKHNLLDTLDWVVIQADQPLKRVFFEAQKAIWEQL